MSKLWDLLRGGHPNRVVLTPEQRQSVYLHSSLWDQLLVLQPDGLPPLKLARHEGALWLAERRTGKLVQVENRKLRSLGVWSAKVRGTDYYRAAWKATDIYIGAPVSLVREPNNEHDSNAVAIHGSPDHGALGHVNKQMAVGLAKVMDSGEPLMAIALSSSPLKVVAGSPAVMAWIQHS